MDVMHATLADLVAWAQANHDYVWLAAWTARETAPRAIDATPLLLEKTIAGVNKIPGGPKFLSVLKPSILRASAQFEKIAASEIADDVPAPTLAAPAPGADPAVAAPVAPAALPPESAAVPLGRCAHCGAALDDPDKCSHCGSATK